MLVWEEGSLVISQWWTIKHIVFHLLNDPMTTPPSLWKLYAFESYVCLHILYFCPTNAEKMTLEPKLLGNYIVCLLIFLSVFSFRGHAQSPPSNITGIVSD